MASTSSSPSTSRASSNPSSECAGQAFARGRPNTRSAFLGWQHRRPLNLIEPPWYGPVCPVVWEGRSREAPPYPDLRPGSRIASTNLLYYIRENHPHSPAKPASARRISVISTCRITQQMRLPPPRAQENAL